MILKLLGSVSVISFAGIWLLDWFRGSLHFFERKLNRDLFLDRLNKEKYLEEVGFNVMNDPW